MQTFDVTPPQFWEKRRECARTKSSADRSTHAANLANGHTNRTRDFSIIASRVTQDRGGDALV